MYIWAAPAGLSDHKKAYVKRRNIRESRGVEGFEESKLIVYIFIYLIFNFIIHIYIYIPKRNISGAGEMPQQLRTIAALTKDPGSIPSTLITASKHP